MEFIINTTIVDYIVVPVSEVKRKLSEGYCLYGSMRYGAYRSQQGFFQTLVKYAPYRITITPLERTCLDWVIQGKTAAEVAKLLGNSKRTVEKHLASLRKKFQCISTRQLIVKMHELGLVRQGKIVVFSEHKS